MGSPDRTGLSDTARRRARHPQFSPLTCVAALLGLTCFLTGAEQGPTPLVTQDPRVLQALTRTLEEEVKLASRPQPYLLLDLSHPALLLKSRGLVLRQFSIAGWRSGGDQPPIITYRLRARPPVSRPKIQPGQDSTEHPIDVHDMPLEYLLAFDHDLVIEVLPPLAERPWHWFKRRWLSSWSRLKTWIGQESSGDFTALPPRLSLILSPEEAQALAWTVTEGMPLVIGRFELP